MAAALTLAIAQLGSYLVYSHLPLHKTYPVNAVLHLTHIRNTGAIFGLFPGNSRMFAVTSTLAVVGLCLILLRNKPAAFYPYICFGLIVGAAASNTCDRLLYGAVIDFIDVQGIPYWGYIFNIADVAIHLGAWPLAIGTLLSPDAHSDNAASGTAHDRD